MSSTRPESPAAKAELLLHAPLSCRATWLPLWLVASATATAAERPRLGSERKCCADVVGEADDGLRCAPPPTLKSIASDTDDVEELFGSCRSDQTCITKQRILKAYFISFLSSVIDKVN